MNTPIQFLLHVSGVEVEGVWLVEDEAEWCVTEGWRWRGERN